MRPNVEIYKHIPLEREMRMPSQAWRGGMEGRLRENPWRKVDFREFGEGDGKKRENGEKEDEDEVEVKECDK